MSSNIETHLREFATTIINNCIFCDVVTAVAKIAEYKGLGIICSIPSSKSIEENGLALYSQEIRVIEDEVSYLQNITYKHNNNAPSVYLVSESEMNSVTVCIPITLPIPPTRYANFVVECLEPLLRDKPIFCVVIDSNGDWQAYEKV
jgi:hypothetical protein